MSKRFFVDSPIAFSRGEQLVLEGTEAHHLIHVMRGAVGDVVILFDGTGKEFAAKINKVQRRSVDLELVSETEVDRELNFDLSIAVAIPKSDRQRFLIEKLTEIGVTRLIPLITERSVSNPKGNSIDRFNRAVIEASKQCGRNRLMQVDQPMRANELFSIANANTVKLIASTTSETSTTLAQAISDTPNELQPVLCAIGPEGGFTESEIETAVSNQWQPITLGTRILRAETAAITIAASLAQHSTR